MAARSELDKIIGLTSREAARILEEEGPNELPSSKQWGNLRIIGSAIIFLGLALNIPLLR